jgi:hypothetical protein
VQRGRLLRGFGGARSSPRWWTCWRGKRRRGSRAGRRRVRKLVPYGTNWTGTARTPTASCKPNSLSVTPTCGPTTSRGSSRACVRRQSRRGWVAKLRAKGMSTRAIADAVKVSDITVRRDLEAGATYVAPDSAPEEEPEQPEEEVEPDEVESEPAPQKQPEPPATVTGKDGGNAHFLTRRRPITRHFRRATSPQLSASASSPRGSGRPAVRPPVPRLPACGGQCRPRRCPTPRS